ncbi:type II secretion system protein N [Marinobacter bohaiensis]|uniref:type II secretion system protein N n=1 Tax=Marinobacter bohaiensis TaxID=2201898 RepID=UPI000DAC3CC8|nr:type II secretion system protein N [Marinobacter bohaiensis]
MAAHPESRFLRPGKVIALLVLALLVYAVALVVWVPAGWAWHMGRSAIELPPGVQVERVSGQLWNGAIQGQVMGHSVQAGWQLEGLFADGGFLPLSWQLQTPASRLEGALLVTGRQSGEVSARGRINVAEFSREIRRSGGAMIDGDISVDRLNAALKDGRLTELAGLATWPGGEVSWPQGGGRQSATLPPMQARLVRDPGAGQVDLLISSTTSPDPVIAATLQPDGMMRIELFKRMLDMVNQPWSGSASPGDVVFSVRQRVLPAG